MNSNWINNFRSILVDMDPTWTVLSYVVLEFKKDVKQSMHAKAGDRRLQ